MRQTKEKRHLHLQNQDTSEDQTIIWLCLVVLFTRIFAFTNAVCCIFTSFIVRSVWFLSYFELFSRIPPNFCSRKKTTVLKLTIFLNTSFFIFLRPLLYTVQTVVYINRNHCEKLLTIVHITFMLNYKRSLIKTIVARGLFFFELFYSVVFCLENHHRIYRRWN